MTDIAPLVELYLQRHPEQRAELQRLIDFARATPTDRLFDRRNFDGHITASAFIVDPQSRRVLLHLHKVFGRFIQPGGHVDPGETPLQAALRETEEEVGLPADALRRLVDPHHPAVPFDIDTHPIPASEKKQEAAHFHHDFRYLYWHRPQGIAGPREAEAVEWVTLETMAQQPDFVRVAAKIRALPEP